MFQVHIFGAGSIGNHLAHACRQKGWDVTMCDVDQEALRRTRDEIYPARYGKWDSSISLTLPEAMTGAADLVIVGTPPDTHMSIAADVFRNAPPRVMLIEKPLCTPDLRGYREVAEASARTGTRVLTGYNHGVTRNTREAERIIASGALGRPLSITVRWLEHWGGIFAAHPWLSGPSDTYLGFAVRGGGACGEHSHAIHLFRHFSGLLGQGRIATVSCLMDLVRDGGADYDRVCQMSVRTENGLVGSIAQDVVTKPAVKTLRVQGETGFLEWYAGYDAGHDAVVWGADGKDIETIRIPRKRPDDFAAEIDEVGRVLAGELLEETLTLERGFEAMCVIAAARRSHDTGRACTIEYTVPAAGG